MDGFEVYKTYLAIKLHFTRDNYNFDQYNGGTRATNDSFNRRNDRFFFHRIANFFATAKFDLIARIISQFSRFLTGIEIHPAAKIGKNFFIDHGTGTVIGETSIIGDHVKMYQGVALIGRSLKGGQALRGTRRHPIIEDRVTLYANATIMGGDTTVGMRSTIGANVFLTHSVPPDSLVLNDAIDLKVLDKKDRNLKEDGEKPPVEQV